MSFSRINRNTHHFLLLIILLLLSSTASGQQNWDVFAAPGVDLRAPMSDPPPANKTGNVNLKAGPNTQIDFYLLLQDEDCQIQPFNIVGRSSTDWHQEWEIGGNAAVKAKVSFDSAVPGTNTKTVQFMDSGNVSIYIDGTFAAGDTFTITVTGVDKKEDGTGVGNDTTIDPNFTAATWTITYTNVFPT